MFGDCVAEDCGQDLTEVWGEWGWPILRSYHARLALVATFFQSARHHKI